MFSMLLVCAPLMLVNFDRDGVPMPVGVTARWGSTRFQVPRRLDWIRFTPDGNECLILSPPLIQSIDLKTGLPKWALDTKLTDASSFGVSSDGHTLFAFGQDPITPQTDRMLPPGQTLVQSKLLSFSLATRKLLHSETISKDAGNGSITAGHPYLVFDRQRKGRDHGAVVIVDLDSPNWDRTTTPMHLVSGTSFYSRPNDDCSRIAVVSREPAEIRVYNPEAIGSKVKERIGDSVMVKFSRDNRYLYYFDMFMERNEQRARISAFDTFTQEIVWKTILLDSADKWDHYELLLDANPETAQIVPVDPARRPARTINLKTGEVGASTASAEWLRVLLHGVAQPGGNLILTVEDGFTVWDARSRTRIAPAKPVPTVPSSNELYFSHDGKHLETVSPHGWSLFARWDTRSGEAILNSNQLRSVLPRGTYRANHHVSRHAKISPPDGPRRYEAMGTMDHLGNKNAWISVIDKQTNQELHRLAPITRAIEINEYEITRDQHYAIASDHFGSCYRWDLTTPDAKPIEFASHPVSQFGSSVGGRRMVASLDSERVAVITHCKVDLIVDGPILCRVEIYDLTTCKILAEFPFKGIVYDLSWSNNSRYLRGQLSAGQPGSAFVFDTQTKTRLDHPRKPLNFNSTAISNDGRTMSGYARNQSEIPLYEVSTRSVRTTIPYAAGAAIAFAPDRRTVAFVAKDQTVHLWPLFPLAKDVPPTTAEIAEAIANLNNADAQKAFAAVRTLCLNPTLGVQALKAAVPAARVPDAAAVWMIQLASPNFQVREAATKKLSELGSVATAILEAELKTTSSPEVRTRIEKILEGSTIVTPNDLRALRALEVLDICNTPEADALRAIWAKGAPSLLTELARQKTRF